MKKVGIIIFIAALVVGVVFANVFSFGKLSGKLFSFNANLAVKGSGSVETEKREVADFKAVDVGGAFIVEIRAQKEFSVEVEADDNLLPLIITEVDGETLKIKNDDGISSKNPIRVRISAPDIENLDVSGASKVSLFDINNDSLQIDASGASKIKIEGATKDLSADMSGASFLDAENLKAENASIEASGASKADVFVSNDLKADLSGASKVYYSGNPKNFENQTSGVSVIKQK